MSKVIKLNCAVQNYLWGKTAENSRVAQFSNNANDATKQYAELWMGTHKKGPSSLINGQSLSAWIGENSNERLGKVASGISNEQDNLPFLFKVLSVNKALSIQVHPNKEHAEKLHIADPEHYPDPNHKPELAIALTPFEALCGFKPVKDIIKCFAGQKEILELLSEYCKTTILKCIPVDNEKHFIKTLFSELFQIENSAEIMLKAVRNKNDLLPEDELFLRLYNQHPKDRGLAVTYLLNHIILQPGEAIFLGANKIHAYFSGDCIECMACSDNVVRAGLTPKFIDVDTLIEMLDYTPSSKSEQVMVPDVNQNITSYLPPVRDFGVSMIRVEGSISVQARASPQITICTEGTGTVATGVEVIDLRPGSVFYTIPNTELSFKGNMTLFSSFCQEL